MEEEKKAGEPEVTPEPEQEETQEEPVVEPKAPKEEPEEEPKEPKKEPDMKDAMRQINARAKKAEVENKALKAQLAVARGTLDVEDYIDISAALEGLDQREKAYLAEQHRMSGKSLSELRGSEDFTFWQTAYRTKVEKEKQALKPSGTQTESTKELPLHLRLKDATLEEKEKILTEVGLYKQPKRHEGPTIGGAQFNAR